MGAGGRVGEETASKAGAAAMEATGAGLAGGGRVGATTEAATTGSVIAKVDAGAAAANEAWARPG
jgi:hypothetical protein